MGAIASPSTAAGFALLRYSASQGSTSTTFGFLSDVGPPVNLEEKCGRCAAERFSLLSCALLLPSKVPLPSEPPVLCLVSGVRSFGPSMLMISPGQENKMGSAFGFGFGNLCPWPLATACDRRPRIPPAPVPPPVFGAAKDRSEIIVIITPSCSVRSCSAGRRSMEAPVVREARNGRPREWEEGVGFAERRSVGESSTFGASGASKLVVDIFCYVLSECFSQSACIGGEPNIPSMKTQPKICFIIHNYSIGSWQKGTLQELQSTTKQLDKRGKTANTLSQGCRGRFRIGQSSTEWPYWLQCRQYRYPPTPRNPFIRCSSGFF